MPNINIESFNAIVKDQSINNGDRINVVDGADVQKCNRGSCGRMIDTITGTRQRQNQATFKAFEKALDEKYGHHGVGLMNTLRHPCTQRQRLTKGDISKTIGLLQKPMAQQQSQIRQEFGKLDSVKGAGLDADRVNVTKDFNKAFAKLRAGLLEQCDKDLVRGKLDVRGRDHRTYATFTNQSMRRMLESWTPEWPMAKSSGLLADIAYALRGVNTGFPTKPTGQYSISGLGEIVRNKGSAAREASVRESAWVKDFVPENSPVKMGISSTTGLVLKLITMLHDTKKSEGENCTKPEVEAVMNGLVDFWSLNKKQITGDYHTPVEVLATYNKYVLENIESEKKPNNSVK